MSDEFAQTAEEFKALQQQMKDPLVIGTLLHKLSQEKQNTNVLFKEITEKLNKLLELEARIARIEVQLQKTQQKTVLSETDEEIVALITQKGRACAEEVQKQFNYKGANAASARLNNLVRQGVLGKVQAGKKVFFMPVSPR